MNKQLLSSLVCFACSPAIFAAPLFNVTSSGTEAQISIELCLNGTGHLSCQQFTVSSLNLNITTTIPNRTYTAAGIRVLTPGYIPTGCTSNNNGNCLFSVSNTTAASIPVISSACPSQANDLIAFSPAVVKVNNPTGGSPNPAQQVSVNMTMCNSLGQPLIPSASNPLHVAFYGAPNGAITPVTITSHSGLVTFTYSGQTFPNNILINAWINDPTNNGYALGQTQILQKNPLPCHYQSNFYEIPLHSTLPDALTIKADVGYSTSSPLSTLKTFALDTGSLGVVVPESELPKNSDVIGPGPQGVTYYDSSGNTYSGNYYLAPVRIQTDTTTVVTQPIMVLGINKAYCSGPRSATCNQSPPTPTLHYLGVGFDRSGTTPPNSTLQDLISTPASNAFLHITNASNGTDVTPGYTLYPSASSATAGLRLGIDPSSVSNFALFDLTPSTTVPGDFLTEYGCYGFTNTTPPAQFCGTLLLDIGISEMFIDLPRAQWPAGTYDGNNKVPEIIPPFNMSIVAGTANQMTYTFDAVQSCPSPTGPNAVAPCYVQWENSTATGQIFVNTGRRALYKYHYLYQGQCGQVGFEAY